MAFVAELTAAPDTFPLGRVFDRLPGATLELERIVPLSSAVVPYVWVRDAAVEDVEAAVDDPHLELVDAVDGECLLKVRWESELQEGLLGTLTGAPVELLSGVGTAEGWRFEVREEDREVVAGLLEDLRADGVAVRLRSIHRVVASDVGWYDLTDTQREALVLAHELGYYDTPRAVTLEEVAAELDISRQALASRLRRGTRRLVENALAT